MAGPVSSFISRITGSTRWILPYPVDEIAPVKDVHVDFQVFVAAAQKAGDEAVFVSVIGAHDVNGFEFRMEGVVKSGEGHFFADEASHIARQDVFVFHDIDIGIFRRHAGDDDLPIHHGIGDGVREAVLGQEAQLAAVVIEVHGDNMGVVKAEAVPCVFCFLVVGHVVSFVTHTGRANRRVARTGLVCGRCFRRLCPLSLVFFPT